MMALFSFVLFISSFIYAQFKETDLVEQLSLNIQLSDSWITTLNNLGILKNPAHILPISVIRSLFKAYPLLQGKIAHISLGSLPTPIEQVKTDFPFTLYIKKDDLTGAYQDEHHLYGGNKVRKLEFLLADALAHDAKTVITLGRAGSNHAIATSVYAKKLGLNCICMLAFQEKTPIVKQNLLMHKAHDSKLHYAQTGSLRQIQTLATWLNHYYEHGNFPYLISVGGSNAIGDLGFVNAAFELKEQINQGLIDLPDYLYVACGSLGTTAGLMLGCKLAQLPITIIPVTIGPVRDLPAYKKALKKFFIQMNVLLHAADESIPLFPIKAKEIFINVDHCGPDYGVYTSEVTEALIQAKKLGINLEGTYTGKTFAALIVDAPKLKDKKVLFWNTYCGLDFSHITNESSSEDLPFCFHSYFN